MKRKTSVRVTPLTWLQLFVNGNLYSGRGFESNRRGIEGRSYDLQGQGLMLGVRRSVYSGEKRESERGRAREGD